MSKEEDKDIKLSAKDDVKTDDVVKLNFPVDATSAEMTFASVEAVPMEVNEQKFFQQTIENSENLSISKFGFMIGWHPGKGFGLHIDVERTPQEKKITIHRFKEESKK